MQAFSVLKSLIGAALVALAVSVPAAAQEQSTPRSFDDGQQQEIRDIVRDYLLENPEVLVEAIQIYQQRQRLAETVRQQQQVEARMAEMVADPDDPVLGNPEGDVTLVEFFDYRCPYCKSVGETVRQVVAEDGGIRLVMKEFPILGPDSTFAARAALASMAQDRYEDFHFAMMNAPGKVTPDQVRAIAAHIGLDVAKLQRDMQSDEIERIINENIALAEDVGIRGTPAFVIGDQVVPGAVDAETLKDLVTRARDSSS